MSHSNLLAAKVKDLSENQQKILSEDFNYSEKCEITQEEIDSLVDVFDTPEKLVLLRKLFLVVTEEERGVTVITPHAGDGQADFEKFGQLTYINQLVQQEIKDALTKAYELVTKQRKINQLNKMTAENKEEAKVEERKEKTAEQEEIAGREVGVNL